jgi:hypothetical protein
MFTREKRLSRQLKVRRGVGGDNYRIDTFVREQLVEVIAHGNM